MRASFDAQIVESWTLPWPEIRVSHYRTGCVGAWELKRQFQGVLRGYFRGLQTAAENYLLTRDGRVWMSLSPVEIESLASHVPRTRGHVVSAGLGMGLALYNVLLRPAVRGVTVVERDPDVIALFEAIRDPDWPCPDRFRIEHADAHMWRSPEPVDYLYADIWDKLGAADNVPQSAAEIGRVLGHGGRFRLVSSSQPVQTAGDPSSIPGLGEHRRCADSSLSQPCLACRGSPMSRPRWSSVARRV